MPVSPSSRHHLLPTIDAPDAGGVPRRTLARRVQPEPPVDARRHLVLGGETMESIARHELGASEAWWLIADANPGVFPLDIRPGMVLAIPSGRPPIERSRRF